MTILLLLLLTSLAWGVWSQVRLNRLEKRFKPVVDIDRYIDSAKQDARSILKNAELERHSIQGRAQAAVIEAQRQAASILENAEVERQTLQRQAQAEVTKANREAEVIKASIRNLEVSKNQSERELERLLEEVRIAQDAAYLQEVGYYENHYEFEDIVSYEKELSRIRECQKSMLREDGTGNNRASAAAYITSALTFNGSTAQGRAAQRQIIKLMLRAFNGECDSFIARVNYRNVSTMEKRIDASFNAVNSITDKYYSCVINEKYLCLRKEELELVYEYEEAKQREKEEQTRIREQIREEEKAARELERARKQAEQEEAKYTEMLRKAQEEVKTASDKDKAKLAKLNKTIADLQQRLEEAEKNKRTISQAELTKTGHVYIISNIGSFGENVFKIGMTRRLEPMDRVKELGDASVPFPFDVHAMIRTSDAPALENALHRHFEHRRMNLENNRKEFFRVSIDEIRQELNRIQDELGIESELRLTLIAEAKEYRMSEAKRKHLGGGSN